MTSTTAPAPPPASTGGRSRAGNAMARTRANILDSALLCVEKYGARRTTMADIATRGRLAKATVYNHFRTKDTLYVAAVEAEVDKLAAAALATTAERGLEVALAEAAATVSAHPALRRVAADEPALLARLVTGGETAGWTAAVDGAAAVLARAGRDPSPAAAVTVVRWLLSHVGVPATAEEAAAGAAVLAAGLSVAASRAEMTRGLDPAGAIGED